MPSQYGGANPYGGSTIYGAGAASTAQAVVLGVGTKYDVALNGVGYRLAHGTKAYVKSAAPTFGFNIRNQLSSATRLAARDLFFWNRWEHNDWTLGESTAVANPGVNDSAFSQSTGFDVTQPGKLSHLPVAVTALNTLEYSNDFESSGITQVVHDDRLFNLNAFTLAAGSGSLASHILTVNGFSSYNFGHPDWKDCTVQVRGRWKTSGKLEVSVHAPDRGYWGTRILGIADGTTLSLWKLINGTYTQVGSSAAAVLTNNTWYWMVISALGTSYTVQLYNDNAGAVGTLVATLTQTIADAVLQQGVAGVSNSASAAVDYGDNFIRVMSVTLTGPADWAYQMDVSGAYDAPSGNWGPINPYGGSKAISIYTPTANSYGYWYNYQNQPAVIGLQPYTLQFHISGPAGYALPVNSIYINVAGSGDNFNDPKAFALTPTYQTDAYAFTPTAGATIATVYLRSLNSANGNIVGTTYFDLPQLYANRTMTAGQTYANFVEDTSGNLWVNDKNTRMWYTSDGGVSWTSVTLPGGDVTDITAVWTDGTSVFCATATNIYKGTTASFANFLTAASVKAGTYYNGAHYIGFGTKLSYVDNAGTKTDLFDTTTYNVTLVVGYQGKIYFGGYKGNLSRLWTWTWTGAPPTPTNGSGAEIQQGTLPNGFLITSATVYLNLLELGGYFPGVGGTSEGVGAVYYINGTLFGQLLQVGTKQTARSWQISSLFGYNNLLLLGYNHKVGIGVYDFAHGAFSSWITTQSYVDHQDNMVLAVAAHKSRYYFLVKKDGRVWRSGDTPVASASIDTLEFNQLAFVPKLIDGHEHAHSGLRAGEKVEIYLSFDQGATWSLSGLDNQPNSLGGNMSLRNVKGQHWRSRLISYVGTDYTKSPQIFEWAERMNPQPTRNHTWKLQIVLQKAGFFKDGSPIQDPDERALQALWAAQSIQGSVDLVDLDSVRYSVIVIDANEVRMSEQLRKAEKLKRYDAIWEVELLEVGS